MVFMLHRRRGGGGEGEPAAPPDREELVPVRRGLGQYGCYYYPRVPCRELSAERMRELDEREVLGSKVQVWSKLLENELAHVQRLVATVPDHPLYFVLPRRVCTLGEADLDPVSDCYVLQKDKNKKAKAKAKAKAKEKEKEKEKAKEKEKEKEKAKEKGKRRGGGDGGGTLSAVPVDLSAFVYDRNAKYINMLLSNIKDGRFMNEHLRALPHSERWMTMVRMYRHVIKGLCHLKAARLIHWDLHIENIMVDPAKGLPYIIDFGLSIDAPHVGERRFISSHFPMFPHFYRWPVETQFLLWSHSLTDKAPLTPESVLKNEAMVPELLEAFTSHMKFLDICSASFRQRYVLGIKALYSGFRIEHARSDLMWLGWQTWDSYSVAVLFLGFICSMYSPAFPVNNRMLRDFFRLLLDGVHYDWRRRPTVEALLERADALLARAYDPEEVVITREYPTFRARGGCPE